MQLERKRHCSGTTKRRVVTGDGRGGAPLAGVARRGGRVLSEQGRESLEDAVIPEQGLLVQHHLPHTTKQQRAVKDAKQHQPDTLRQAPNCVA